MAKDLKTVPTVWKRVSVKQDKQSLPETAVTLAGTNLAVLFSTNSVHMVPKKGEQKQAVTAVVKGKVSVPKGKQFFGFLVEIRGNADIVGCASVNLVAAVSRYGNTITKQMATTSAGAGSLNERFCEVYLAATPKPCSDSTEASFELRIALLVSRNDLDQEVLASIDTVDVDALVY